MHASTWAIGDEGEEESVDSRVWERDGENKKDKVKKGIFRIQN